MCGVGVEFVSPRFFILGPWGRLYMASIRTGALLRSKLHDDAIPLFQSPNVFDVFDRTVVGRHVLPLPLAVSGKLVGRGHYSPAIYYIPSRPCAAYVDREAVVKKPH